MKFFCLARPYNPVGTIKGDGALAHSYSVERDTVYNRVEKVGAQKVENVGA